MNTTALTHALDDQHTWPLYSVAQTQSIEEQAQAELPAHTLMQRAGLATAQLALAIAPHAEHIWLACGPGNNGGDGLEAALHLKAWGKKPCVTWLGTLENAPADAQEAWRRAIAAGVSIQIEVPKTFDLAIDALLGIGATRAPNETMSNWLNVMAQSQKHVLCVDVPTGLLANTGEWLDTLTPHCANRHTLSLLTLKPGLFTASGRDAAGQVWFNDLGVKTSHPPCAWLHHKQPHRPQNVHASHKGSLGDVIVLGGAAGMSGAAVLAGIAALHGGAGRVFVGLLDETSRMGVLATNPALMVRSPVDLNFTTSTVVCGCGGGYEIHEHLAKVLSSAHRLVLDADALNAIARDTSLQTLLKKRDARNKSTVLTPHPLEAARLLGASTQTVQSNRLDAAKKLAEKFMCTVVLKGSGSVIAQPNTPTVINGSGNARLATAGTGDVLAGLIGAYLAQSSDVFEATCQAVYAHGKVADTWPATGPALDAARLAAWVR